MRELAPALQGLTERRQASGSPTSAVLPLNGGWLNLPFMAAAEGPPHITEEEYLAGESRSKVKHEYFDGRVWAMAGASDSHELVSGNLFALLWNHLRGKGCRVYKSDMKVRLALTGRPLFYYQTSWWCANRMKSTRSIAKGHA